MKKFLLALAASAMTALGAFADKPTTGSIYTIFPEPEAIHGADQPLVAGQKVKFVVRLLAYDFDTTTPTAWTLKHKGEVTSETFDAVYSPLQVGIIVSGKLTPATIVSVTSPDVISGAAIVHPYTDLHCEYSVENGDLALPVQLALKGSTELKPKYVDGNVMESGTAEYCLLNNDKWELTAEITGEKAETGMYFTTQAKANQAKLRWKDLGDWTRDYDLTQAAFTVKTLKADQSAYTVEKTTTRSGSLVLDGANESIAETLYVWTRNENVVKLTGEGVEEMTFDKDYVAGTKHYVKTITLPKGVTSAPFTMLGLAESGNDDLIISPTKGYQTNAAGDIVKNYLDVKVNGAVAPPPNIRLSFSETDPSQNEKRINTPILMDKIAPQPVYVTLSEPATGAFNIKLTATCGTVDPLADHEIAITKTGGERSTFNEPAYTTIPVAVGQSTAVFYVYPLGGTAETADAGISFTIQAEGTTQYQDLEGATLILNSDHKPVIVEPAMTGAEPYDCGSVPVAGFELPVVIKDCYRDMKDKTYTIKVSYSNSKVWTLNNVSLPTGTGTITIKNFGPAAGPRQATIRVSETENALAFSETKIKFDVIPAKTVKAVLCDPKTSQPLPAGASLKEGENVAIRFVLSEPDEAGETRYAYAKAADGNIAETVVDFLKLKTTAVVIPGGETESSELGLIKLLDGSEDTDGMLGNPLLAVQLSTTKSLAAGEVDPTFDASELELTVDNVAPETTGVLVGDNMDPVPAGEAAPNGVPCGVPVPFTVTFDEPSEADLAAKPFVIWAHTDDAQASKYVYKLTRAETTEATTDITFNQRDTKQKLFVMVVDKDMNKALGTKALTDTSTATQIATAVKELRNQGAQEYAIVIPVNTKPAVMLDPVDFYDSLTIEETATTGFIRVKLTDPATKEYTIKVKAEPATNGSNPGFFAFNDGTAAGTQEIEITIAQGATEPAESDAYEFGKGLKIKYTALDGTSRSYDDGWKLTTTIVNDDGYYQTPARTIYIMNMTPVIRPAQPSNLSTNKAESLGKPFTLTWSAKDVAKDVEGKLTARWFINDTEEKNLKTEIGPDQAGVEQTTTITLRHEGVSVVRLEVSDKEGEDYNGKATREWIYEIAPSKRIVVTPVGPSTNTRSRYRIAPGLGQGRVWADGGLSMVESFSQTWNYGIKEADARVYAFGYPAGTVVDNGTLSTRDVAINQSGDTLEAGQDAYTRTSELNSFFYRWMYVIPSENGSAATYEAGPIDPKMSTDEVFATVVQLDKWEEKKESYLTRQVEAIFSREYMPNDMVGDINADGIPDIVVMDTTIGGSELGGVPEDDYADLSKENGDEDFLPLTSRNVFASQIPGVPQSWIDSAAYPFTAKMEIRGYHDGLNDALTKFPGVHGAKVAADYNSDDLAARVSCRAKSYSEAEMRAWEEAGYAKEWSPENPTDPMKADTDGDGLPDGYEYYYWYWAHVGVLDKDGNLNRLTGERYNPLHPEKGDLISWREIEEKINPTVPYPGGINKDSIDSDNDGLSDMLEYELGTNPFHWDTDGDGMPDGWEVRRSNTDPRVADQDKNNDGDYMASIQVSGYSIIAKPNAETGRPDYFAVPVGVTVEHEDTGKKIWHFTALGNHYGILLDDQEDESSKANYFREVTLPGGDQMIYLAQDLRFTKLVRITIEDNKFVRGLAEELPEGVIVRSEPEYVDLTVNKLVDGYQGPEATFDQRAYSVMRYGNKTETNQILPVFVIIKAVDISTEEPIVAILSEGQHHTYLIHHMVYQRRGFYFAEDDDAGQVDGLGGLTLKKDMGTGFNPLTAWNIDKFGFVGSRWDSPKTPKSDPDVFPPSNGRAVDTRGYEALDEFLVMNFRHLCGQISDAEVTPSATLPIATIWSRQTTMAGVPKAADGEAPEQGAAADTDADGVPDGWELYVAAGPGSAYLGEGRGNNYVHINPGLLNPIRDKFDVTNDLNRDPITGAQSGDLSVAQEFRATDSCIAYANCPSIPESNGNWINKFWPTDPWSCDTDGDGMKDGAEGGQFVYGSAKFNDVRTDDGSMCIPGGGLNPCSMDTDIDGLPDPWEAQFAGTYVTPDTAGMYTDDPVIGRDYARRMAAEAIALTAQASGCYFVGGMDGTTQDSYTRADFGDSELIRNVNRDYDYDGLDPWQEYLTGMIRAFRYDDVLSPWEAPKLPEGGFTEAMLDEFMRDGKPLNPNLVQGGNSAQNELSGGSNPNLVFGKHDMWAAYGTLARREWDVAAGGWYFFPDGPNHCLKKASNAYEREVVRVQDTDVLAVFDDENATDDAVRVALGLAGLALDQSTGPSRYATTDPRKADSDNDGLDDYYELFHGLNPLYGGERGLDLVNLSWLSVSAKNNYWTLVKLDQARGESDSEKYYDFALFPWMAGDPAADPDGDDIRTAEEAIQPNAQAAATWLHTDPTPLWMTDKYDLKSIVSTGYRWASMLDQEPATVGDTAYHPEGALIPEMLATHRWSVISGYNFEFEMNEGFDSDHDGLSDKQEGSAYAAGQTDPQDENDPHRRQAMYFPGDKSALQANDDPLFMANMNSQLNFLEFTVECWVKPEDVSKAQVIIERAVQAPNSNPMDAKMVRRNFQLGINEAGEFYAAYDHNGTGADRIIAAQKQQAVANRWVHLAGVYDGSELKLYVNEVCAARTPSALHPTTASITITTQVTTVDKGDVIHTMAVVADHRAIIIGASAKDPVAGMPSALDLASGEGNTSWNAYEKFFKGYVDEVRIWDGARTEQEILQNYKKAFTAADVDENRDAVYDALIRGGSRSVKREDATVALPAELCYHYGFSGLFAGATPDEVAKTPYGYDAANGKAAMARPEGWVEPWWSALEIRSTVYTADNYIPWIANTVTHMPRFDGTTQDSIYWSEDFAGWIKATDVGYEKYVFPRKRELYPTRQALVTGLLSVPTRLTQLNELENGVDDNRLALMAYTDHAKGLDGTDLLPLGGAFVKYSSDFWDGQGSTTTWEVTQVDTDNDGLADWWEIANYGSLEAVSADTLVDYNGQKVPAIDVYRRDIAHGAHPNAPEGDEKFVQSSDENSNGLPDWWERLYQLNGAKGQDDTDGDGLSNYAEFLLSEVFDVGATFDPRNPKSVDQFNLDYFFKIGELYAGEIFTDHDMMEDVWEDLYAANPKAVSRLKYDANVDSDGDGWSNGAEARYSQMSREISADSVNHWSASNELQSDYPIPAINMTVSYNGLDRTAMENVSLVVASTTDPTLTKAYDAKWLVTGATAADGSSSSSSGETTGDKTFVIGRWSDRHVIGNLTPGNIKPESITLQHAFDPASDILVWTVNGGEDAKRGTREEYFADVRKYTKDNVALVEGDKDYRNLISGIYARVDSETRTWTLRLNGSQKVICTVNLDTGAFDVDLGALGGAFFRNSGDETGAWISSKDQTYRLAYSTNPSVGMPRKLYLGQADEGHAREGKNSFVVWAETVDANGEWDPGEPFGFVNDIDVGWNTAEVKVELTESNPVSARIRIADGENDRQYWWGSESGNVTNMLEGVVPSERMVRVRVVRTLINDRGLAPNKQMINGNQVTIPELINLPNTVVLDKRIDLGVRDFIHEGDILAALCSDGSKNFDIDWETFSSEVMGSEELAGEDPTRVGYRIVLGEGSVDPLETNNVAKVGFTRSFDSLGMRKIARPQLELGVIKEARPRLKWTMDNANSYPAFRVSIYKKANFTEKVWTSEIMHSPVREMAANDSISHYVWDLPIGVGERFPGTTATLDNDTEYYWTVMMYNAKFREYPGDDDALYTLKSIPCGKFRMAVPTDTNACGTAPVAVKYFGPKATYTPGTYVKGPVRVQAFASPDFKGEHVAGAIVTDLASMSKADVEHKVNATVLGIPAGTYYFLAFVDANDNGVCDEWETKGYLCSRGHASAVPYNPTGVKYGEELGVTEMFTIYLEDADTDNDCLPDGWEMAKYGSLDAVGTETLEAGTDDSAANAAIGISLSKKLVAALTRQDKAITPTAGMAGTLLMSLNNPTVAALILGLEPNANGQFVLPAPTVLDNGVTIESIAFNPAAGTVVLKVATEAAGPTVANAFASTVYTTSAQSTVKLTIEYSKDLTTWSKTSPIEIVVKPGTSEETIEKTVKELKGSNAGFFRVQIEQ